MRDFLPEDVRRREYVIGIIKRVYERYGFEPLETPAVENIETLMGKYGEEGNQLIFKILKRGEHEKTGEADLALRYDLTVPLARVVAQYQAKLPRLFKRYQIQPVWRADRPARGRFREFYQCDVDALGTTSPLVEAELCAAVSDALTELGFHDFVIRLNHRQLLTSLLALAGVPADRHGGALVALDKLDKIGRDGVERELREAGYEEGAIAKLFDLFLSAEDGGPEARLERLARIVPATAEAAESLRTIVRAVAREAGDRAILKFDPSLVRGMGYYTGPIFEAVYGGGTSAIAGGGRYDRMVGRLLGHDVPACGFSIGFERVVSILEERSEPAEAARERIAFLFDRDDPLTEVVAAAGRLRGGDRVVSLTLKRKNLARQLDDLAGEGFGSYAVLRPGADRPEIKPLARRASGGAGADG
jgi:histidyl-tRNA synthetase